jgi:hypothetical protein
MLSDSWCTNPDNTVPSWRAAGRPRLTASEDSGLPRGLRGWEAAGLAARRLGAAVAIAPTALAMRAAVLTVALPAETPESAMTPWAPVLNSIDMITVLVLSPLRPASCGHRAGVAQLPLTGGRSCSAS